MAASHEQSWGVRPARFRLFVFAVVQLHLLTLYSADGQAQLLWSDSGVTKPIRGEAHRSALTSEPSVYQADEQCHANLHAGYDGHAFTWGMSFRTASAQECCDACRAHAKICPRDDKNAPIPQFFAASGQSGSTACGHESGVPATFVCNAWVFCPEPMCWSSDIHNHTFGECWLKHQDDPSRPRSPSNGAYPHHYRREHTTAPELVQWMSGVIVPEGTVVLPGEAAWVKASA